MTLKSSIMWSQSIFSALSLSTSFYGHHSPINPLYCPLSKDILWFPTAGMAFLNFFYYNFIHFSRPRLKSLFLINQLIHKSISLSHPGFKVFSLVNQSISLLHLFTYFYITPVALWNLPAPSHSLLHASRPTLVLHTSSPPLRVKGSA